MKTLIELFDECQLENVIAGLKLLPEKIVFVGFKSVMTSRRISDLENLFKSRGLKVKFQYELVGRYDYDAVYYKLTALTRENEDCAFDLTGGNELIVAAMGEVAAKENIPVVQFDVRTGKFIRIKNCEKISDPSLVALSFKETVSLNGGVVVDKMPEEFEWILTDEFKSDLQKMWDICRNDCSVWNKQTNVLSGFADTAQLQTSLSVKAKKQSLNTDKDFMNKLLRAGLISEYKENGDYVSFRYKNQSVRHTLMKAGSILELYTYMLLREIADEEPSFYDDILTGVVVDWDGVVYRSFRFPADTRNELDIVVMRDAVPVFVSCKNGEVHKEAFYELDTVSKKFGGKYAKKALISTYVTFNEKGKKHLETRARDMNIEFIHGVNNLTREEFKNLLKNKLR